MGEILYPIKGAEISQRFNEKSFHDSSHIHGALDLAAGVGTPIVAPEDGTIFGWLSYRPKEGIYWPETPKVFDIPFAFANYFYDMYGGVTLLETKERTHLFCHSYGNQIFNKIFKEENKIYVEQKEDARWPICAIYTIKKDVKRGDVIAYVGKSGFNSGAHLHWEIHKGRNTYYKYEDRIDPESLL